MLRNTLIAGAIIAAIVLAAPLRAAPVATELSAQSQVKNQVKNQVKKKRPQIRVTPRYPRATTNTPYPRPYDVQYPGPNAKRQCVARLVQEARPSGTVIVPRQRCWWVRG